MEPLVRIFEGWEGYQASLLKAVAPRSPEELTWKPAAHLRSAGELAAHISYGRIIWGARMGAPGSEDLAAEVRQVPDPEAIVKNPAELVQWLEKSWNMLAATLDKWTVTDLRTTYRQEYQGRAYAVTRQWTLWRILAHDLHHGGELAVTFGLQGIELPELGELGGHLTMPPLLEE